jgi:transcriptional regulator with XRE-family HTH domain
MEFKDLQERLRILLCARVSSGELTGSSLARRVGLRQAHVSNFLSRKRGMSVGAMDSVLGVLRISVLDLADPDEINRRVTLIEPPTASAFVNVVMVTPETAARQTFISAEHVVAIYKFRKSFMKKLRPALVRRKKDFRRFVLFKVDEYSGVGMYPRLQPGATVLIDRHYNSLAPYRAGEKSMYAVKKFDTAVIRYIDLREGHIALRPINPAYATEIIELRPGEAAEDYIVGRVAHVAIET